MEPKLLVHDLRKSYGSVEAVRGVSFEIGEGEILGLLGPNGAGKTSALECVIGLRRPDAGSIEVCGVDALAQPNRVKQFFGAQLQSTALQDKITPREAIDLFRSFYARPAQTNNLIDRFSLGEKADEPFDSLSGGQRQRLALALAFVNNPQVLFLDEPTTGLDPQSRRELHESVKRMRSEGKTVLLTTHYIEEAAELCDRIAIIDGGRIVTTDTPKALIAGSKTLSLITLKVSKPTEPDPFTRLPGVQNVEWQQDRGSLRTAKIGETLVDLVNLLQSRGLEILDLQVRRPTLEDVFIELTGSRLRD